MVFVNKSGGDGEQESTDVAAGAPPSFEIDFDPNDPDQVKVHYNLTGWGFDQRAELAETLAELGVPHAWDGEELIVPEVIESDVDALFDRLEAEIGPLPVPLLEGDASTEFGLDEWPVLDIETLKQALVESEIPHLWQGRTLLVAQDAEAVVDDLLDAIEAGDVVSLDEQGEAPEGALHNLYVAADRLERDATHTPGRTTVLNLVPQLSPAMPPFGLAVAAWRVIVERAYVLLALFESAADPELIKNGAAELRQACRPYV